jgi:hypothetical protein
MMRDKNITSGQLRLPGVVEAEGSDRIDSVFDLTPEEVERLKRVKPKLLGLRCGRTDCAKGLHCFDRSRVRRRYKQGACQQCGAELIDWGEVWLRDSRDIEKKFEFFRREWIRHFFFHVPITGRIEKYARRFGQLGLAEVLEKQLRQNKMLRYIPALDGRQTKMLDGTIVHWARHAVGCCCRGCMSYWHNIPLDQELTGSDVAYLKGLAVKFIVKRMPDLASEAVCKLPRAAMLSDRTSGAN